MWIDRRWPRVILAVSLLANIFLIGVVTGHVFDGKRAPAPRPGQGAVGWVRSSTLPPDDKRAFAAVMRSHHEALEAKRAVLKNAKAALQAAVTTPVYDRSKVADAFADVRRASVESQEATQAALVEALGTLSPAARASLMPAR
jgi:uncharacterized membrane protein